MGYYEGNTYYITDNEVKVNQLIIGALEKDSIKKFLFTKDVGYLCPHTYVFDPNYTIKIKYEFDPKIDLDWIRQRSNAIIDKLYDSHLKAAFDAESKDDLVVVHCQEV